MKNLTPKARQVVIVTVATLAVLAGIWFGLIEKQYAKLRKLAVQVSDTQKKLDTVKLTVKTATTVEDTLTQALQEIEVVEANMATGDYYSWIFNTVRQFKLPYRQLEIPQFSSIVGPTDTKLLPQFPYKQVAVTLGGSGYYHEIGRFIADFENQFPYAQIQNLELEPAPSVATGDKEKLSFRLDVVTLVKPTSALPTPP